MDKKKPKIYSSTPARAESVSDSTFTFKTGEEIPEIPMYIKKKKSALDMVLEAVQAVGVDKTGASFVAIKKYIQNTYEEQDMPKKMILKKAVLKAIEKGLLGRPARSKATGVTGSFTLINKVTKKSKDIKAVSSKETIKPGIRGEQVSDSEAMAKKPKTKKLNLSDSAINDLEEISDKPKTNVRKTKLEKPPAAKLQKPSKTKSERPKKSEKPSAKPEQLKGKPEKLGTKPEKPKAEPKKPTKASAVKNTEVKIGDKQRGKDKTIRERKDVSDSEVVVKKPNRKSLKSYSSDTELGTSKIKTAKKPPQELPTARRKRLFKPPEEQIPTKTDVTLKTGRRKAKNEI